MSKKKGNHNKQNNSQANRPVVKEQEIVQAQVIEKEEEPEEEISVDEEVVEEFDEEEESRAAFRRKRVKRIKYILVLLLILFLLIPNVVCGFLLFKLHQMNRNMEELKEEIRLSQEEIERRTKESAAGLADETANNDADSEKANALENLTLLHLSDEQKYPGKQLVYLTFDDGPSDYTDEILDILKEHNAKATFFVLAKEGYDEQYNRILAEGHTLGMHSYSHKYSVIYSSMDAYREDVNAISSFLESKTGLRPKFYRFPGGSSNDVSDNNMQDMLHFLSSEGYTYYDWNVSSEDASRNMKDTSVIVKNVVNGIGDKTNSVVLMHDSTAKSTTVEALPVILETLQQKGNVEFLPITENTKQIYHVKEEARTEESGLPEDEDGETETETVTETVTESEE